MNKQMITFIYGSSGSGKSYAIYEKIIETLRQGKSALLIVPEQQAVIAERRIADMTEASSEHISTVNLEVLNFSRLANRVFREFGGISYNYIDRGARALIMWQALFDVAPVLSEYGSAAYEPLRFIPIISSMIKEFSDCGVTSAMLESAADKLDREHHRLSCKLRDMSMIYAAYNGILSKGFDDPSDDITKMNKLLKEHDFFGDYSVFIDSFDSFSEKEYDTVNLIFRQSRNVFLSLCTHKYNNSPAFEDIVHVKNRLWNMASEYCSPEQLILTENKRTKSPALAILETELFNLGTFEYTASDNQDADNHINLISCKNVFAEAEFAAKDILKKIRSGCRYRDIAVIVRDYERYDGIIDAVFDKYQIPYHITKRTDISASPVCKIVSAAMAVYNYGWRRKDVIAYLKTGITNLTLDECDKIEKYTYTWNISGKRWTDEFEWTMHPDGYIPDMDENTIAEIDEINRIRAKITIPLLEFFSCFSEKRSAKETVAALYKFLCDIGVPDRLTQSGDDDSMLVWNTLMNCLDQIALVLSDLIITSEQFSVIYSIVTREADTGKLPENIDQVNIGSADHLRAENIKHVYLLGLNEGIFPAAVKENNIFSDSDKKFLENCGIILSPDSDRSTSRELFWLYKSAVCASDSATFICSEAELSGKALKPSIGFLRIHTLFPERKIKRESDFTYDELIEGYDASFEYVAMLGEKNEGQALKNIYSEDSEYSAKIDALKIPISDKEASISEETAKLIFPGDVSVTQSRLDSYVLCSFGYYCKYVLKVKENSKASFKATDTGTFVHHILEAFVRKIRQGNRIRTDIPESELEVMVDNIIEEYLESIFKNNAAMRTNRIMQLIRRLKRSVMLIIRNLLEEFSQSDFVPAFFEMPISNTNASDSARSMKIPLPDGTNAYIYGVIDRVDTYVKDGNVYVRVVDYKTGSKEFSLSDLALGLNLQMLLYLFSIWFSNSEAIRKSAGCNGDILPAGVLYYIAKTPELTYQNRQSPETVLRAVGDNMKKAGMLLNDEEILRAMEKSLGGKYIPVKIKKDGALVSSLSLQSLEEFGALMKDVSQKVSEIVSEMKSGYADARPIRDSKHDACEYCPLKPICRQI